MAIKVAVATLPPISLTAIRILLAAAVLYGVLLLKGEHLPRSGQVWVYCFFIGVMGNGLPFFLIGWGEVQIDSGLAAILMSVMPLATILLAHFFTEGDHLTMSRTVGIAVGFLGVIILVGRGAMEGLGDEIWRELAVAGGALCYAVAAILTRNVPEASLLGRACAVMICATLQIIPVALVMDEPWLLSPEPIAWLAAAYLGLLPTALATLILFALVAARGASFIAVINYMIPALGVVWGVVLLSETVSTQELLALATILAGIAIANFKPRWIGWAA